GDGPLAGGGAVELGVGDVAVDVGLPALVAVAVLLGHGHGGGGVRAVGSPDLSGGAADDGAGAAVNVANGLRDAVETGGVDDAVLIEVDGGNFAAALGAVGVKRGQTIGVGLAEELTEVVVGHGGLGGVGVFHAHGATCEIGIGFYPLGFAIAFADLEFLGPLPGLAGGGPGAVGVAHGRDGGAGNFRHAAVGIGDLDASAGAGGSGGLSHRGDHAAANRIVVGVGGFVACGNGIQRHELVVFVVNHRGHGIGGRLKPAGHIIDILFEAETGAFGRGGVNDRSVHGDPMTLGDAVGGVVMNFIDHSQ